MKRPQSQVRLPWHTADHRQYLDFWWDEGATRLPQAVIEAVGGNVPGSGAAILGTEGAILLPHIGAPALHPVDKFADRAIPMARERKRLDQLGDLLWR